MDRTERFYLIDRLLHERRLVTRREFLQALEVSPATFKRDLEYMRERFNAPIAWNAERGGYEFAIAGDGPKYALPGLWFNSSEIARPRRISWCRPSRLSGAEPRASHEARN